MNREEAIQALKEMHDSFDEIHENTNYEIGYEQMTALDMAIEALQAEETIEIKPMEIKGDFRIDDIDENRRSIFEDIVWIVRCKDCRYYNPIDENKPYPCGYGMYMCNKDDFCSYGERSEK